MVDADVALQNELLAPAQPPDERTAGVIRIDEFEAIARERLHPGSYDYIAGGAWDELSLAENEAAWRRRLLRPRVLLDVSAIDTATTILGNPTSLPLAIAPMAAHALAHPDAEVATARAAAAAGVPFVLSTMSSSSIEEVADAAPGGVRFFQLYTQADPGLSRSLVERTAAAGYAAIVLTVDLPVLGYRERERRRGFDLSVPHGNLPSTVSSTGVADSGYEQLEQPRGVPLTWASLAEIRSWSSLPLVLKGVMTAEDARLAVEHGVDAICVSNHGARQLDRVHAPIDVLEEIAGAVAGRAELWVDGGVRRGLDLLIARALGARAVLIGRPILYALAAAGEGGVRRALDILRDELETAMKLTGTHTVERIDRTLVDPAPVVGPPVDRPQHETGRNPTYS